MASAVAMARERAGSRGDEFAPAVVGMRTTFDEPVLFELIDDR